jgi:hypothetical protein
MPSTFQGLAVVLVALLPGALYVWTFERIVGRWGIGFSDRLFRFLGISIVFHAFCAPVTYVIWHDYLRRGAQPAGHELPLWLWPIAMAYVLVPAGIGTTVGIAYRAGHRWARLLTGSAAPTAWDAVFGSDPAGWVLIRLKSGTWVGGAYADGSYSAGFPHPADLFLSEEYHVNQETGDFIRDADGGPLPLSYGLLVRWDEIEYLEFAPEGVDGEDDG